MDPIVLDSVKSKDRSLTEQVADRINQLIIDRHLTTRDKLPNEFELMEQLNVGRGTVREAVKLLVARNVLEIKRGKGTYVAKYPGVTSDPLGFAYMPDEMKLAKELMEIRTHLEPWVASLAAQRATEDDLAELRDLCRQVEDLIHEGKDHLGVDEQFHKCIACCTQNRVVTKLIPVITYSVHLFGNLSESNLLEGTIKTHRNICDKICQRDPDGAHFAMLEHLIMNRTYLSDLEKSKRR